VAIYKINPDSDLHLDISGNIGISNNVKLNGGFYQAEIPNPKQIYSNVK
jgi:hypothetical protein